MADLRQPPPRPASLFPQLEAFQQPPQAAAAASAAAASPARNSQTPRIPAAPWDWVPEPAALKSSSWTLFSSPDFWNPNLPLITAELLLSSQASFPLSLMLTPSPVTSGVSEGPAMWCKGLGVLPMAPLLPLEPCLLLYPVVLQEQGPSCPLWWCQDPHLQVGFRFRSVPPVVPPLVPPDARHPGASGKASKAATKL